jgi:hypothetical protein
LPALATLAKKPSFPISFFTKETELFHLLLQAAFEHEVAEAEALWRGFSKGLPASGFW